jgi:outer membrane murein-binding lipoprotein Lpp
MNPLAGLSAGMLAGGVLVGYMAGSATVDFGATQEINRLNSEVKKQSQDVNNHKTFIRTKDTAARRFCNEYFKGEKK